jgi:hypothetical protein
MAGGQRLVAVGTNNRVIAEAIGISVNISMKIDAHSKAEATAYALRHNLAWCESHKYCPTCRHPRLTMMRGGFIMEAT